MDYYRPVQAGLATIKEMQAMSYQQITELNQIAESLLKENANRIAASIGMLFSDGKKK